MRERERDKIKNRMRDKKRKISLGNILKQTNIGSLQGKGFDFNGKIQTN